MASCRHGARKRLGGRPYASRYHAREGARRAALHTREHADENKVYSGRPGRGAEGKLLLMVYARFFVYGLQSRAPSTDSEV